MCIRKKINKLVSAPFSVLHWLLYLVVWILGTTHAFAQQLPRPELITDQQGLPQAFIPGIVQDRDGFIWVATRDGLCRYDGQRFRVFQPQSGSKPSLSFTGLEGLTLDRHGRIWILTEKKDLDLFDPRTERFVNVSRQPFYQRAVRNQPVFHLCVDRQDRIWLALYANGLICINPRTKQIRQFRHQPTQSGSLGSDSLTRVCQAPNGTIWVATRSGLERYNEATQTFTHFRHQPGQLNSLPENSLCGLQVRPDGQVLTVSQRFVSRFDPATQQFRVYPLPINNTQWMDSEMALDASGTLYFALHGTLFRFTDQQGPVVLAQWNQLAERCTELFIDRSQVLWVGTNGAGIRKYDLRAAAFQVEPYARNFYQDVLSPHYLAIPASQLPPAPELANLNSYNFRYTIQKKRYLWCSVGSSEVYRIDLVGKRTEKFVLPVAFHTDGIDPNPCPLGTDPQDRVWAIHGNQVWWFNEPQSRWVNLPRSLGLPSNIYALAFVKDDNFFWLATAQDGLWRFEPATGKLRQYAHRPADSTSLTNNTLFCLSADPQQSHWLWIGTFGSGVCRLDKRSGRCLRLTQQQGLPNNVIYSVIPDQQGYLWIGTNKGLCRMDRRTLLTQNFTRADGLMADEFNRFHYLHLPGLERQTGASQDERIILGGLEGITAFYPRQVGTDTYQPRVELTDLEINNQPASASLLDSLPIQAVNALRLAYNQNFITATFAALQFNRTGKNRYRYRLEGLETDWKQTDLPVATYTNLPPGTYALVVNATNTSGVWSRYTRQLAIRIEPPFWTTWWAISLYGIALVGAVWWLLRSYLNRLRLRQAVVLQRKELTLQQQQAQQLKLIDNLKSNFFTNITHEFRTPLTLILGPAEQLGHRLHDAGDRQHLATIRRNADQVLNLVNQLLELSKLEAGALPLTEVRDDLTQFIQQQASLFSDMAQQKGIDLQVDTAELAKAYWFDNDKLERILSNLLSNALKFTGQGKQVRVEARPTEQGVRLTVADTGMGMAAHQLPHIFDRFYQGGSSSTASEARGSYSPTGPTLSAASPGTGIGLALVKELVGLQGGQIAVSSQPGQGTRFVIDLPYRVADEVVAADQPDSTGDNPARAEEPALIQTDERALVLVVEDNDELARFILNSLPAECRGIWAANGQLGWEQALAEIPDLIISDVMMPVLDGYGLSNRLKTDLRTSHIPLIMLTAKAATDDRLEGLSRGANDYLTKPFHVAELQARVRNQLATQRQLRAWMQDRLGQPSADAALPTESPSEPDPFLIRLHGLLDAHLEDPAYGVEQLADALAMSRPGLYRKLKSLTGMAPTDVVRLYRLKRGGELLRMGASVTEAAYLTGFQNASHFGRLFREQYGLTPSQYASLEKAVG